MPLHPEPASRREQLYEVSVFLFLIVPSMLLSSSVIRSRGDLSFPILAVFTIFRDLSLVALLLFFLWRNGEPWRRLGWTFHHVWRELFLGAILFPPTFFAANLLQGYLQAAGFSAPRHALPTFLVLSGRAELFLAGLLVVVVAIAEETIFRGYLLLRFQGINLSAANAVLLSGLIFSLGHSYEGAAGVLSVFFLGTVFALVYLWRQSLVAPIMMHFLQDFTGIILAPLLGLR